MSLSLVETILYLEEEENGNRHDVETRSIINEDVDSVQVEAGNIATNRFEQPTWHL